MSEAAIREALNDFNAHHTHELECRLKSSDEDGFTVRLTGTFCRTCGFLDYFDDLQILLEDGFGIPALIERIDEVPGGADVRYSYKQ